MRNYNQEALDIEGKKYSYTFDALMRRYMMDTFKDHFREGKTLELGCHKGDFTSLLVDRFADVTVVEASKDMADEVASRFGGRIDVIHGMIEEVDLKPEYDNIFLINVLEHLDDPVVALEKIKTFLSENGRLFVVVPNALAMSRVIAKQMGIVAELTDVTDGEHVHGHRRTYTAGSLFDDICFADLTTFCTVGGIFFKPLANYQFDLALEQDIVSKAYMDACYEIGGKGRDDCASLYVICGK